MPLKRPITSYSTASHINIRCRRPPLPKKLQSKFQLHLLRLLEMSVFYYEPFYNSGRFFEQGPCPLQVANVRFSSLTYSYSITDWQGRAFLHRYITFAAECRKYDWENMIYDISTLKQRFKFSGYIRLLSVTTYQAEASS